jgi:hypothetical protein
MDIKPLALVAVLAIVSLVSPPRSASAGDIVGTWYGDVSYMLEVVVNGSFVGYSSGSYFGQMVLDYSGANLTMTIGTYYSEGSQYFDPFGPNSATGTIFGPPSYSGVNVGNYEVTYQSILPDGTIDTMNGTAVADIFVNMGDPLGNGELGNVDFQSVGSQPIPEPSSLVLAGAAILIMGMIAWMRTFRPRPWARPA